jgi:hypothetical protein
MIAVLITGASVRLGQTRMPDNCRLIHFGGTYFVRTSETAVLDDANVETGVVFEAAEAHCEITLDVFKPTSNYSKRQGER